MKLPFRRNNKEDVPAEIKEYYQAERRERVGVAWAVALLTLLITVGIVMGLFFGGRWLYRSLANRDRNQPATTQNQPPETPQQGTASQSTGQGSPAPGNTPSNPNSSTPNQPGSQSGNAQAPRGNNPAAEAPAASPPTSATPPAISTNNLPNNGPGEVFAGAVAAALASGMLHRYYWQRRSR